jgi:hypothetical protein
MALATKRNRKGLVHSVKRALRASTLERDRQDTQLRATAWDVADGIFFLLTFTSVLGVTALLVTFADALWHW